MNKQICKEKIEAARKRLDKSSRGSDEEYYANLLLENWKVFNLYKQAVNLWGEDLQLRMAIEEMSELTQEICKLSRYETCNYPQIIQRIAEEVADVEIMLEQIKVMFNIFDEVYQFRNKKLERLAQMIEVARLGKGLKYDQTNKNTKE